MIDYLRCCLMTIEYGDCTKRTLLLRDLLDGEKITSYEAFRRYQMLRLAAEIHLFREELDIPIETTLVEKTSVYGRKTRYGMYRIPEEDCNHPLK